MNCMRWFGWLAGMAIGVAHAQGYPTKPVRMITPFPAGPADVLGRIVGDRLGKSLGQPFIMESRPGAAGNLGTEQVV